MKENNPSNLTLLIILVLQVVLFFALLDTYRSIKKEGEEIQASMSNLIKN